MNPEARRAAVIGPARRALVRLPLASKGDPVNMPTDFPPSYIDLTQRQLSQYGRVGATRVYRTPVIAAIGAGLDSNPVPIQFREPGIVIAAYGQEIAGTVANLAGTEVRVQVGGTEDLFTDGTAGQFVPLLALFGSTQNWFPMLRRAVPGIDWQITFRNRTAGNVTPVFALAFLGDRDLAAAARR